MRPTSLLYCARNAWPSLDLWKAFTSQHRYWYMERSISLKVDCNNHYCVHEIKIAKPTQAFYFPSAFLCIFNTTHFGFWACCSDNPGDILFLSEGASILKKFFAAGFSFNAVRNSSGMSKFISGRLGLSRMPFLSLLQFLPNPRGSFV